MIRIVCTQSPLTMLPIRALLQHIEFRPTSFREQVSYAFLFPFSSHYRKALAGLSLIERVPEAQFFGVVSQWRVRRWLGWLARAVAPKIANKRLFFYDVEHLDEPSRLFLSMLSCYTPAGSVNLMYGSPSKGGAIVARSTTFMASEERLLYPLLLKDADDITEAESAFLKKALTGCVLSANYWQAECVAQALMSTQRSQALYALGIAARFRENFAAAELFYMRAVKEEDAPPLIQFEAYYARAVVHLRFYPPEMRDLNVTRHCLEQAEVVLAENDFTPESHAYARIMLAGVQALVAFRARSHDRAWRYTETMRNIIESLPASERRECCLVTVLGNQAQLQRVLGNLEKSLELNHQVVLRDPQLPMAWTEYIKCLLDLRLFERVGATLSEALSLHHECAQLHALHGQYLRSTGQHAHSLSAFERAARYAPDVHVYREAVRHAQQRLRERGVAVLL